MSLKKLMTVHIKFRLQIPKNISNQIPKKYSCESCRTINRLTGNYISLIKEADFLADPQKYIEKSPCVWAFYLIYYALAISPSVQ